MISKILFPMECRVAVLHGTNVRSEMWRNSQGVVFRRGREGGREAGAFFGARIPAIKSTRNLSCWNKPWARYSISLHNERNLIAGLTITRKTTPMLSKWQALLNVSIMETSFGVILWPYWDCQPTPHPTVWPGKHLLQLMTLDSCSAPVWYIPSTW